MRNAARLGVLLASLGLAGCNSQPPASATGADVDFGGWSWHALKELNAAAGDGGVSASWGTWQKKFVYLLLTDTDTSADTTINTSGALTEYKVALTWSKSRKTEMRIETADGKGGSVTFEGQSYDLAQGPVLVLLPKGEKLELRQLKRDLSVMPAGFGSVVKLLRDDAEIARVFAK